jgi:hypothetical protein
MEAGRIGVEWIGYEFKRIGRRELDYLITRTRLLDFRTKELHTKFLELI